MPNPGGIVAGDVIVIGVSVTDFLITAFPADLTQIIADTTDQVHMTLFSKISGADPASWAFAFSSTSWASITLVAYSGVAALGNSASKVLLPQPNTSPVAPSIAVTAPSTLVCCFYGWGSLNNGVHGTLPGTLTTRENPSPNGFNMSAVGDFVPPSTPSGDQIATLGVTDRNVGVQLGLVG